MRHHSPSLATGMVIGFTLLMGAHAQGHDNSHRDVPHYDLEMTSRELQDALEQQLPLRKKLVDQELETIISVGKRSIDWIEHINTFRPDYNKLVLTSPETQPAYPIAKPRMSNPSIIKNDYQVFLTAVPVAIREILLNDMPFPQDPPIDDEKFLTFARHLDLIYAASSRWLLQEPYLDLYANRSVKDVRGYFHLSGIDFLDNVLRSWQNLHEQDRGQLRNSLVLICHNNGTSKDLCLDEFQQTITSDSHPLAFKNKYWEKSQKLWESFFKVPVTREDMDWPTNRAQKAVLPFALPESEEVRDWLETNIKDEWQWADWQLALDFQPLKPGIAHVVFEPGATPHVDRLAGDRITMDANRPITGYDVQWTIRHEFGHVLGLPDCYIEFYDTDTSTMISYQLDITNLMCSRQGKLKAVHYDALKQAYQ